MNDQAKNYISIQEAIKRQLQIHYRLEEEIEEGLQHDGERTKVWDVEYDPNDEWLIELRQGATRRLEELWAEPPITSEADYHQSMIADD